MHESVVMLYILSSPYLIENYLNLVFLAIKYQLSNTLKQFFFEKLPRSWDSAQKLNALAHIRTQHSDDSKKFKCEKCEFSTHTQKNLTQHIYVRHKKDEHMKCEICDKRFPQAFLLKQHMEITHKG